MVSGKKWASQRFARYKGVYNFIKTRFKKVKQLLSSVVLESSFIEKKLKVDYVNLNDSTLPNGKQYSQHSGGDKAWVIFQVKTDGTQRLLLTSVTKYWSQKALFLTDGRSSASSINMQLAKNGKLTTAVVDQFQNAQRTKYLRNSAVWDPAATMLFGGISASAGDTVVIKTSGKKFGN